MSVDRPTFSPFWHRVRTMKPRLRPHVNITRQRYRGRIWHVVHDPTSNQFFRLNPVAHDFVGLLDGGRDVETAWKISLSKFGDVAPTQNEVIQLISQLHNANLLSADTTPETEQLLRRGRERIKKKIQQQAIGIMYFKIRLFNPDRIVTFFEPMFRILINRWGFLLWAAFIIFGLTRLLPNWDQLAGGFEDAIAPKNWPWLIVVFIVLKAIHELGHGVICKRFGGQVPEFGVMMLVLFPAPYVDASACWAFPSKWQRMAVGAGGMIFELFMATCAGFIWLNTQQGELVHQIAYNAMFTASISTILFNANPLMRFDGYYILADFLEVPNLVQRSNKMLKHLIQKYIYRLENLTPPSSARGEQAVLIIYGIAALAYRIFLFISITLYVMGKLFGIGLALAIWTATAWFVLPVGSFIHWLATNPKLAEHRFRHVMTSAAMGAVIIVLLGVIPMPDHRRAVGIVDAVTSGGVHAGAPGFVEEVLVEPGQRVDAGEVIARLSNPDLRQRWTIERLKLRDFRMQERNALAENNPAAARIARDGVRVQLERLTEIEERLARLEVRSPHGGVIAGGDPRDLLGAYMQIGEPICRVVDVSDVRIAAVLTQRESWIMEMPRERYTFEVRPMADIDIFLKGGSIEVRALGERVLPSASLAFVGGGDFATEADDQSGRRSKSHHFLAYIRPELDGALPADASGEAARAWEERVLSLVDQKVRVRFTLPSKPLAVQWWDRLSKLIQGRVNI